MLVRDLKDEFKRRLGDAEDEILVFFAGAGLDLLGGVSQCFGGDVLSCALSAGTYALVRANYSNNMTVQKSSSDLMYSCDIDALGLYKDKDWSTPIYKVLDRLEEHFFVADGMDFLFRYSAEDETCDSTPIAAGLAATRCSCAPTTLLKACAIGELSNQSKSAILAAAAGRAHSMLHIHAQNYQHTYLGFPLSDHKLVFTILDQKKPRNLKPQFEDCLEHLKKEFPALVSVLDLKESDLAYFRTKLPEFAVYAQFAWNEQARITQATQVLSSRRTTALQDFGTILTESAKELLPLFGKSEKDLASLFECEMTLKISKGCRVLDDGRGIVSIVKDADVDRFMEQLKSVYMEQSGTAPVFYICDTADSGIQLTT